MVKDQTPAFLFAVVLAAFAGLSLWRGQPVRAAVALACAVALASAALVSRAFADWFHRAWLRAAHALVATHTLAVLAVLYFVGFTAYRVWGRMTGKDALGRRAPPRESYWVRRTRTHPDRWQFERLY
jgi:hypothetical protein